MCSLHNFLHTVSCSLQNMRVMVYSYKVVGVIGSVQLLWLNRMAINWRFVSCTRVHTGITLRHLRRVNVSAACLRACHVHLPRRPTGASDHIQLWRSAARVRAVVDYSLRQMSLSLWVNVANCRDERCSLTIYYTCCVTLICGALEEHLVTYTRNAS